MAQLLQRAPGLSLRDVLPEGRFFGQPDIALLSCTADSRQCQPGDLYVAITGPNADGHDFVQDAIEHGATAIVAERPLPCSVPTCVVSDSREAYGRICHALAGQPSQRLMSVGITGTNGKTTVSELLAAIIRAAAGTPGVMNSLRNDDSLKRVQPKTANPQPPEWATWLAQMTLNHCSHAILECSTQSLALRRTAGMELDAAIITNIRRAPHDFHGTTPNYRKAIARILSHLRPTGFVVTNADDPASRQLNEKIKRPALTFGINMPAEVTARVIERLPSEQTFLLSAGSETVPVRTAMIGDHHVYNCLAATATALVMGYELTTIVRGLESVGHLKGRMERLECGQPYSVFVDRADTPDRLACSLHALRSVTAGRVICVTGGPASLSPERRANLGRVVERAADLIVLTSNNPEHERPLTLAHDLLDGFERPGRPHLIADRSQAIEWALGEAVAGDTVLIAGKGDEAFQCLGSRKVAHDDREVAKHWLRGEGAQRTAESAPVILPFPSGNSLN